MLLLRCSRCRGKLVRYDKIGPGALLRCHKDRIDRFYGARERGGRLVCRCGQVVGLDKGSFYKMIDNRFTRRGTWRRG